jgi:hypothetical protein
MGTVSSQMTSAQAQLEHFRQQADLMRQKQEAEIAERQRVTAAGENAKKEQQAVALAGPGAVDILAGNFQTPAAQASLEKLAADADQSWTGFYNSDAVRMDAMLQRLGVSDPGRRQALVVQYGIGKPLAPGRSGPISAFFNWLSGPPQYQQAGNN